MLCPHDQTPLVVSDSEGHAGRVCGVCHGTWLPFSFIESIQYARKFKAADFIKQLEGITKQKSKLRCPSNCGVLSEAAAQSIALDWCPSCKGIWFDSGELKKLLASLPRHENEVPPWYLAAEGGRGVLEIILMALMS